MEPPGTPLNHTYIFYAKIKRIEERERIVSTRKMLDNEVLQTIEKLGWYVQFDGSWESLYFGNEPPQDWKVGDEIRLIFCKVST